MSKALSARFSIIGAGPLATPGEFEVFGDVIDSSLDGYSVSDVIAGNVFFDENIMTGLHNRYKVLSVVATGPSAYSGATPNSIHLNSVYEDEGSFDPDGPAASQGIICAETSLGMVEVPSWTVQGISEQIVTRARNIDMRKIMNPAILAASGGGVSFQKSMKNTSGVIIPAGTPVSKMSDGGITASDSDISTSMVFVGITGALIGIGSFGNVLVPCPNMAGVLTGKGFASGDNVYMSETTGQFAKSAGDFTGQNDRIVRIGIADCADGEISGTAKDLLMFIQVIGKY